ncbi:MAG TPA: hypothetical protein VEO54_12460 [Thermoanaerobaculia bacterium]|nr:hypothetical protein [Thermoanaerobaculia bacterium]
MNKIAEVLAGLRQEEQRLLVELAGVQRAIGALEEVLGTAPVPAADPEPPAPPAPYATSTLYQAVADYLVKTGEPRTTRQIAEALQAGGYPTRARDFAATVRTMLQRYGIASEFGIRRNETDGRWFVKA